MKIFKPVLIVKTFFLSTVFFCNSSYLMAQSPVASQQSAFEQLSPPRRAQFIDSLAVRLAADSNYRTYVRSQAQVLQQLGSMKRGVPDTVKFSRSWSHDRQMEYYKAKGMANPDLFLDARDRMSSYMILFLLKHPAYSRLPISGKMLVDRKAKAIISSGE